jgi:TRAP-type transport system periplasmic protein
VLLVAATSVLASGCGGAGTGANKAGGSGPPVVLRMADAYNPDLELEPAVEYFARRLRELSDGTVRVRVVEDWGEERSTAEQKVVRAVADGNAELGWVGTRIFDTLGVTSFQSRARASRTRRPPIWARSGGRSRPSTTHSSRIHRPGC